MNKVIQIQENQSLLDLAVKQYGDIDAVFEILALNNELDLEQKTVAGNELISGSDINDISSYLSTADIATDDFGFAVQTIDEGWESQVSFDYDYSNPNEVSIEDNQSLLDIAALKYGDIDKVFEILALNDALGLEAKTPVGTKVNVVFESNITSRYLSDKNIATDDLNESLSDWILATGYWRDEGVWFDTEIWID